jgi:hypothetical protein
MMQSPKHILAAIALVLAVVAFFWPLPWQVPTILLAIAIVLP